MQVVLAEIAGSGYLAAVALLYEEDKP